MWTEAQFVTDEKHKYKFESHHLWKGLGRLSGRLAFIRVRIALHFDADRSHAFAGDFGFDFW